MSNRRTFLHRAFASGAALFAARSLSAQTMKMPMPMPKPPDAPAAPPQTQSTRPARQAPPPLASHVPVVTTDVGDLAYTMDGGTKVFHLVAEVLKQKIHPDKTIDAWGFNGSAPGPTIQVNQGDHVRVIFDNHLPSQAPSTGTALKTRSVSTACRS